MTRPTRFPRRPARRGDGVSESESARARGRLLFPDTDGTETRDRLRARDATAAATSSVGRPAGEARARGFRAFRAHGPMASGRARTGLRPPATPAGEGSAGLGHVAPRRRDGRAVTVTATRRAGRTALGVRRAETRRVYCTPTSCRDDGRYTREKRAPPTEEAAGPLYPTRVRCGSAKLKIEGRWQMIYHAYESRGAAVTLTSLRVHMNIIYIMCYKFYNI